MDNTDTAKIIVSGAWPTATHTNAYGYSTTKTYLHDNNQNPGTKSVRFTPTLPQSGPYQVFGWWCAVAPVSGKVCASNVPIDILHSGGKSTVQVNQRLQGGQWVSLGVYKLCGGSFAH